jgi:tRNA threonylcarbamoyladenosine biosynthesis protein TsaB
MSLLLHIDTAVENASVCISKNGELIGIAENKNQKDHATWIQPAIQSLMKEAVYNLKELDAVAVSNGPGSYTGLRVGLATAKGLCFALNKPLITLSTLEVMTIAALNIPISNINYFCPLIDARRMEVFTAIYDISLKTILRHMQGSLMRTVLLINWLITVFSSLEAAPQNVNPLFNRLMLCLKSLSIMHQP